MSKIKSIAALSLFLLVCLPIMSTTVTGSTNSLFEVRVGDVFEYKVDMEGTSEWALEVDYAGISILQFNFSESETHVAAELTAVESSVLAQLTYKNRITTDLTVEYFIVYKSSLLNQESLLALVNDTTTERSIEVKSDTTVITDYQPEKNLTTVRTYDNQKAILLELTSQNADGNSFTLKKIAYGDSIFGLHPKDTRLLLLLWNIGFVIVIGAIFLRLLPEKETFEKIRVDNSVFNSLWFTTLIVDIKRSIDEFKAGGSRYYNLELLFLLSISLIFTPIYKAVTYAYNTLGVINLLSLFIPYLLVESLRIVLWVGSAVILSYIIQHKKINPYKKETERISIVPIAKIYTYLYSVVASLYFFVSWIVTFRTDNAKVTGIPIRYYGSLTKGFIPVPLFKFLASVFHEIGILLFLFWFVMLFVLVFFRIALPNLRGIQGSIDDEKQIVITRTISIIFSAIWILVIFIFEIIIFPDIISLLLRL